MIEIESPTPRDAFELLLAGNQRFVTGAPSTRTRTPPAAPRSRRPSSPSPCYSGVPSPGWPATEIIFDRGLGDLFVVRTAGQVMGAEVMGSIEYGINVLGCPLVVVLGHDSCDAVGAACAALEDGMEYVRDVRRAGDTQRAGGAGGRTG